MKYPGLDSDLPLLAGPGHGAGGRAAAHLRHPGAGVDLRPLHVGEGEDGA